MWLVNPSFSSICCPEDSADSQIKITTDNSPSVGISKGNSPKLTGCSACLRHPVLSSVGRPKNDTVIADNGPNVGIDKIDSEKACGLRVLRSPGLPSVCRSVNCSVKEADGSAVILVAEVYGIKQVSCVARLLLPVITAVCCPQDDSRVADDGSDLGLDEV